MIDACTTQTQIKNDNKGTYKVKGSRKRNNKKKIQK